MFPPLSRAGFGDLVTNTPATDVGRLLDHIRLHLLCRMCAGRGRLCNTCGGSGMDRDAKVEDLQPYFGREA